MQVETLVLGPLETNCYIIKKDNCCLLIDPAANIEEIKKHINNPTAVLITHYHFDHIGALKELKEEQIPIYDNQTLGNIEIGPFHFSVIPFKGHHESCVAFYFEEEKKMFVGDFIFKESIGRMDLETGSEEEMNDSIECIKKYPDDIMIYPGHGETTTLEHEKKYNPYF